MLSGIPVAQPPAETRLLNRCSLRIVPTYVGRNHRRLPDCGFAGGAVAQAAACDSAARTALSAEAAVRCMACARLPLALATLHGVEG